MNDVKQKITFILPGYITVPMGGVKVVNRLAELLSQKNYDVILVYPKNLGLGFLHKIKTLIKKRLDNKHGVQQRLYYAPAEKVDAIVVKEISEKYIPQADFLIAVGWQTAEPVSFLSNQKGEKCYFLQSYEGYFTNSQKVNATYLLNLKKIAISSWIQKEMVKLGTKALGPVGNAINRSEFFPEKNVEKSIDVLMLYHPAKIKNARFGLRVLEYLKKQDKNFRAAIFTARKPLHKIPEWIKVVIRPDSEKLRRLYNVSKIYFSTSKWEGWGLPPMEAMACGCAVVAVKNKGLEEFLEKEKNAYLIGSKNKLAAAEKIRKLLKDEELRQNFINQGYRTLEKYSEEEVVEKFERCLRENK